MQMMREQQPAVAVFAAGMIGLGVLGLIYGDFALVWQPVASWVPGRTALAYVAAIVMLVGGFGLLFEATVRWSARLLFVYCVLWALLKVPALFVAPLVEGVWLGIGELLVLLAGAWTLFALLGAWQETGVGRFVAGPNGVRAARYMFAVFLIPIGLAHLMYVKETAALIPVWFPNQIFWAYLTGAGQIACGLGVLFGVLTRIAVVTEAVMISLFGLLVWLPRVIATPKERLPWTAFFITWVIAGAAWVVAENIVTRKTVKAEETVAAR